MPLTRHEHWTSCSRRQGPANGYSPATCRSCDTEPLEAAWPGVELGMARTEQGELSDAQREQLRRARSCQ